MKLSIEVITDHDDPVPIVRDLDVNSTRSCVTFSFLIASLIKVYDPIALHIIEPSKWEVKVDGKEKE